MNITPVGNKFRSYLHDLPPPDEWTSKQCHRLVQAVLAGRTPTDLSSTQNTVTTSITVCSVNYGQEITKQMIYEDLRLAEAKIESLRRKLTVIGTEAFAPRSGPEVAPRRDPDDDQQSYMRRWLRSIHAAGRQITRAGNSRFVINAQGTYVAADPEAVA
jgi:hypothetical protein